MADTDTSMIKVGPAGDNAGIVWDEKGRSELVQIFISQGTLINSLQFQYVENGGALVLSDAHGKLAGDNFHVVKLDYPSEYLTGLSGSRDNVGVSSITFHTNLHTRGPFGKPESNYYNIHKDFCFALGKDRQFGGFHGTANDGLTSIGVYVKPITTLNANAGPVKVEVK